MFLDKNQRQKKKLTEEYELCDGSEKGVKLLTRTFKGKHYTILQKEKTDLISLICLQNLILNQLVINPANLCRYNW